ncbi:MAG: hypothetical protein AAFZ87_17620 [Planctomycetota bacterium]
MTGFASRDDSPKSPRFRVVDAAAEGTTEEAAPATVDGVTALISERLLVEPESWRERRGTPAAGHTTLRVDVPLISSLARIRSEADAALALTGVLELVARRFHVALPCAWSEGSAFWCDAPAQTDPDALAAVVNDDLLALVRATDLQGALRENYLARVTEVALDDVR